MGEYHHVKPVIEYYHVTTADNWEKIQKEGLVPQIGERSQKVGEPRPAVFLFDSEVGLEDAMYGWLGEEYEDELGDLVLLSVVPPKGMLLDEAATCGYEVRCYEAIPPECISLISDEY